MWCTGPMIAGDITTPVFMKSLFTFGSGDKDKVISFRLEVAACPASLLGSVKILFLLRALWLRTRSKDNAAAKRRLRRCINNA
jgi:hypothetical protein